MTGLSLRTIQSITGNITNLSTKFRNGNSQKKNTNMLKKPLLGFTKEFHPQLQMGTGIIPVRRIAAVSNRSVTNVGTLHCANDAITNIRSEITICDAREPRK